MVTNLIIVICAVIFVYINFISKSNKTDTALRLGAFYAPYLQYDKQYYRLITSHFVHIDFFHCFMNCYCIYSLGGFFESLLGPIAYIILVVGSMLGSSLMTYSAAKVSTRYEHTITLGASGIFYGYLGAMIALAILIGGVFMNLLSEFALVIVMNLAFTFMNRGVSKTGHIGGAFGGFVAIFVLMLLGII